MKRQVLPTDTGQISYSFLAEKGPILISIHGWMESMDHYLLLDDQLPSTLARLYFDLRGHGQSIYKGNDFSIDAHCSDLIILLKHLKVADRKVILVGHSMGGIIATKLTQSDINIVGLVYLNSTINYRFVNPFADLINQLMPRVINSRYFPLIARLAFGITTDQKAVDIHQASLLAAQPYAAIGSYRNTILNHDLADILSSLQYPVMVVGGGIDPVLPLNHTFNIIRYARDPKFLFLPFSGHYSMMEYPIRVAAQLLRYIERA